MFASGVDAFFEVIMLKVKSLIITFYKGFLFLLCYAIFAFLLAIAIPYVLTPSRTALIVALSFTVSYIMLSRIYGGMDIGTRKSRSIVFSMILVLLFADLIAHLFLCIMDYTVLHGRHFVYEAPILLATAYATQVLVVIGAAYVGNGIFFTIFKPQKSLVVYAKGADVSAFVKKIESLQKQYAVRATLPYDPADPERAFRLIEKAEAVFFYGLTATERASLVEYAYRMKTDIYYSIEMNDVVAVGGKMVSFEDTPVIFSPVKNNDMVFRVLKKLTDLFVSLIGIILLMPLFIVVAIIIKSEDGGPVFYKQPRITIAGKKFNLVKFRSMRPEVGDIHRSVTENDDRITRVGRVIRKFRIDEFPQLFNVLLGDMSLVGPRPEMVENVRTYSQELPEFAYRQRMKAGITGLAQVYGKYNTLPKDKLMYDLMYIEQANIWLDIKILLRTVLVLFTPEESTEAFRDPDEFEEKEDKKEGI